MITYKHKHASSETFENGDNAGLQSKEVNKFKLYFMFLVTEIN